MNQLEHWKHVKRLESDWLYYEAADRGYDFNAATAAREIYYKESRFYALWWGVEWSPIYPPDAVPLHT